MSNVLGDSTRTELRFNTDDLVIFEASTRDLIRTCASALEMLFIKAPKRRAFVIVAASSISSASVSIRPRIVFLYASLMFSPALLTTSYKAFNIAFRTPVSLVFVPVTSSAIKGSTLGLSVSKVPKAFAARERRTSLPVSANDFAKVRCNCGKKGFRNSGIFSSRLFNVNKIAAA